MKIKVFLILIALIFLLAGCADYSLPIFDLTVNPKNKEDVRVTIEGVPYEFYPLLKWELMHGDFQAIGYAGSRRRKVYALEEYEDRNFIFLENNSPSAGVNQLQILHRVDKTIPNPTTDSVSNIVYMETDYRGKGRKYYSNEVDDIGIMIDLFEVLDSGEETLEMQEFNEFRLYLECYSDEVPGAYYQLEIGMNGDKLVCDNFDGDFVEISRDLLERLAGRSIDFEALFSE